MSGVLGLAAAVMLALAPDPAPPAAPPPPAPVGEVVVTAKPKADAVHQFVDQFSAPAGDDGLLTRWDDEVCPGVIGLKADDGQYLNDRMAEVALRVGLKVGKPGCTPNVLIVVAPDVKGLMQALSHHRRELGAVDEIGDTTSGGSRRETFDSFLAAPRPVNWWHVSERVDSDTGGSVLGGVLHSDILASRLRSTTRENLRYVLVVVDAQQVKGVSLQALGGYLSMATLAQLAPDAPVGRLPTIMSLFDDRAAGRKPQPALTQWDFAYLKGLYSLRGDAPNAETQRRHIAGSIEAAPSPPAAH